MENCTNILYTQYVQNIIHYMRGNGRACRGLWTETGCLYGGSSNTVQTLMPFCVRRQKSLGFNVKALLAFVFN